MEERPLDKVRTFCYRDTLDSDGLRFSEVDNMTTKHLEELQSKGTYLEGESYTKPTGILRLQINGALNSIMPEDSGPISKKEFEKVASMIAVEIMDLVEDWGEVIRGIKDKPISLERVRRKKR